MPFSDYVPQFGESNLSTYYRNVLGVPVRKRIVIAVLTVLILFLIFVGALVYAKYGKPENRNGKSVPPEYIPIASAINISADPCTNFYEFTCGRWSKNKLVTESDETRVTSFSILQKFIDEKKKNIFKNSQVSENFPRTVNDAIGFYNLCVTSGKTSDIEINYLLKYFKHVLGGWPILHPENWNGENFNWTEVSTHLIKTLGVETIVGFDSIVDDNNSSQSVLYMRPPAFTGDGTLDDFHSSYMLSTVLTCLNHSDIFVIHVDESIQKIRETESLWRKHFLKSRSVHQNRTRMTFQELNERMPNFDWMHYIQLIMNDTLNEIGKEISEEDVVVVDHYEFLDSSINGFKSENISKFDLANLFGWFVVQEVWFLIPGVIRKYSDLYGENEDEIKENKENKCFKAVQDLYGCSFDYLFVQNSSHSGLSDGIVLVHNIKKVIKELIGTSEWLDDLTKDSAILKLDSMRSVIGFQNYLSNKREFEKLYQDFPPLPTSVMQAYFQIKEYFLSALVTEITFQNISDFISPRSITAVSAYYDLQRNVFTLPISIYNKPFYYYKGPWFFNFGAIGSVIGHEIMHGFDNTSRQRDGTGTITNWWSSDSSEAYKRRLDCFNKQYGSYKNLNNSVSEITTLNEDIADSEGLRLAYLAYKQWVKSKGSEQPHLIMKKRYSPDKMFFIAFGSLWCSKTDSDWQQMSFYHSLPESRLIGAVSNSKYFATAFNCPKGSPMNPDKKCLLW